MNADQLKDKWMQVKRELHLKWDDDLQQIGGSYARFVANVQGRYGDKKRELTKWVDAWHQKSGPEDKEKKPR